MEYERLFRDEKCEFDPDANIVGIFLAIFGSVIAIYITCITIADYPANTLFFHFFGDGISLVKIFSDEKISARQIMILCGFFSNIIFYSFLLLYLSRYVDVIWNRFYVQRGDKTLYYVFTVAYALMMIFSSVYPHYWYVSLPFLCVFISLAIRFRRNEIKQKIEKDGGYEIYNDVIYIGERKSGFISQDITTRYVAIRHIHRNFLVKSIMFGIPLWVGFWACHALRESNSGEFSLFFTGAYSALSCIFSFLGAVGMYLRWRYTLPIMAQRIAANDAEYFRHLAR